MTVSYIVALQEKHPEITYNLYGPMKYHLQTRLESISPTQKPKNGILLSKVPLRRHPWHGNDWDKSSNCWTWLRWCGERHDVMTHDRGPHFTSFLGWLKRYSLNFHIAEIWDLQLSKVNCEEIERLQLYPPHAMVRTQTVQTDQDGGVVLRICCFPIFSLQTRLNNKF